MSRRLAILFASLAIILSASQVNAYASACRDGLTLRPVHTRDEGYQHRRDDQYECKCVGQGNRQENLLPGCSAQLLNSDKAPRCIPHCKPQPSGRPYPGNGGGGSNKSPGNGKPSKSLPDGSPSHCSHSDMACPVKGSSGRNMDYECISPQEDLYNCGGCSITGQGQDCSQLPGVRTVSCQAGRCDIHSCSYGFNLENTKKSGKMCTQPSKDHGHGDRY